MKRERAMKALRRKLKAKKKQEAQRQKQMEIQVPEGHELVERVSWPIEAKESVYFDAPSSFLSLRTVSLVAVPKADTGTSVDKVEDGKGEEERNDFMVLAASRSHRKNNGGPSPLDTYSTSV